MNQVIIKGGDIQIEATNMGVMEPRQEAAVNKKHELQELHNSINDTLPTRSIAREMGVIENASR